MSACSVVIASYQTGPILFATLKRVLAQEGLREVIVVDNGNTPAMLARLQQMALEESRIQVITGQGNLGIARACNLGAAQARGEYLLFLQPDCLVAPEALVTSMEVLEGTAGAIIAGAWLVNGNGREQQSGYEHMGCAAGAARHALRFGKGYRPTTFIPSGAFEVEAVPGAFLCISKAHFRMLGGFDEALFLGVEDIELCRRARNMGKKVLKLPQVAVTQLHSGTGKRVHAVAMARARAKGLIYYFRKHDRNQMRFYARWGLNALLMLEFYWFALRHRICGDKVLGLRERLTYFLAMGLVEMPEGESLKGRHVLLNGATGDIGVCVLRRLIAEGASVVAVTRQEGLPFWHERLWWVRADFEDVQFALPDLRLDAVVHCAPLMYLPRHLARLSVLGVTRVVAFGSTSLFSRAASKNAFDRDMVEELRAAESEIETVCGTMQMRWTILRPTVSYGMEMDGGISRMMRFIRRFRFFPVYPPAMGKRHPVHVDDAARAALQVLDCEAGYNKAYNLSGAELMTFRGMVERIFDAVGVRRRVVASTVFPFALDVVGKLLQKKEINAEIAYRMNDDLVFFHQSARDDFGYDPRGFLQEMKE